MTSAIKLPELPARHADIVDYIADNPGKSMSEIMDSYRKYEAELRTLFAQNRKDQRLNDPYINVLPLFTDKTARITTRARDLAAETQEEKDRYIMALPDDKRRPHGSPATVDSLSSFRKNFGIFSENSLADLDWSNVVAAGSSVVNCLLPVPPEFNTTKRKLREYYHEKFCPASDVDLFLYGLNEEQAIEKIKQIEQAVRDAILSEVTVVRTKYAITIASQYPTRHVQIVLRSYSSVSEILSGFDIDAAGGAYDGNQVYVTPRAIASFITQINQVDLSRRSPSYENRLSKYSHRNFEVYWPELDRSKVDPTIFERSFRRTLGLARLLVLERLPTSNAREVYLNKRRQERGRPTVFPNRARLWGNIKDRHEDEVADWVDESDVANYHTFTIPYGERFHAKKIEKLCYTKDLLLNAEWNQPKEREVYLHRHPAFFGRVEDVIKDCCGYCPVPVTPEEIEAAEKEAEIYISGNVTLLIDDPGRQQIGSFNPLTEDDWTDMAYVGNTARLCHSIVDSDVEEVLDWLSQPDADANQRDHTGRSPLHLAVMCSTPEVVKCLVDHGARLTARLADGKTALHLAAERGITEIIKLLMDKSIANEEEEEEKQDQKRKVMHQSHKGKSSSDNEDKGTTEDDAESDEDSDVEVVDKEDSDDGVQSIATGSFVKVKSEPKDATEEFEAPDESAPDFYSIDVLAWDIPSSPLHLAIACGHEDAVKMLCDYGADALLPVKFVEESKPVGAILTLTLAMKLPLDKAKSMAKLLLDLGATSSQADLDGRTVLLQCAALGLEEMFDLLVEHDQIGVQAAINHLLIPSFRGYPEGSPLHFAIVSGNIGLVLSLLNAGAKLEIDFETWLKAAKVSPESTRLGTFNRNKESFNERRTHPLITALHNTPNADLAITLLEKGADPNSMTQTAYYALKNEHTRRYSKGETVLDHVRSILAHLRRYNPVRAKPVLTPGMDECLSGYAEGTYQHWTVSRNIAQTKSVYEDEMKEYEKETCSVRSKKDETSKKARMAALKDMISGLEELEKMLVSKGAKTFAELYPDIVRKNLNLYTDETMGEKPVKTKPYNYNFRFLRATDLTQSRDDAYIQLFEAAWAGDMEKIDSLTLRAWGEDQSEIPLKIAVHDSDYNTPFSLAFYRGYYDVAWRIAEIAHAQYSPPDEEKKLYRLDMRGGNDDETTDLDSDNEPYSDSEEPRIVSRTVDDKFTIDNIGEISMQVKSETKAIDFIQFSCNAFEVKDGVPVPETCRRETAFNFFIRRGGSMGAFKRFLNMCIHFDGKSYGTAPRADSTSFTLDEGTFRYMVEAGRVDMLKEVIRRTGAGIPLDHLVKKTGVEMQEKPRYYPGLSVYGKKRKDWATAGRNMRVSPMGLKTPPLLHAAVKAQREAVEWLLSEEPLKLYVEYSQSKAAREDSRLKHLTTAPGRFENVVARWLGNREELVLHSAVIAEDAIDLVKYLVKAFPVSLEARDNLSNTPLLAAAYLGRVECMKVLIEAGADQSVRNSSGENVTHRMVQHVEKANRLRSALDLLDEDLRLDLLTQRTSLESGGMTPFHLLVNKFQNNHNNFHNRVKILRTLFEYSKGAGIEMLNSAGHSPLHTAVMAKSVWLTKLLVELCPRLLYREDAVGRTPTEVAGQKYLAEVFERPRYATHRAKYDTPRAWLNHAVPGAERDRWAWNYSYTGTGEWNPDNGEVWRICREAMERYPDRRRLLSLHEANDVANRIGQQYVSGRYYNHRSRDDEDAEQEAMDGEDVEKADENVVDDVFGQWARGGVRSAWNRQLTEEERKRKREPGLQLEVCGECGHGHAREEKEKDSDCESD